MKCKRKARSKTSKMIDNRYRVMKKLGKGGMGVVYKVRDIVSKKVVALKMLTEEASQSVAVQRFKREFYYLTQLRHPNLVEVYDFGLTDGRYYFTMEYVEGRNLREALGGFSYEEMYPVIVQVCRALEYIHSRGIIHYDVKPSNILIATEQVSKGVSEKKTPIPPDTVSSVFCAKLMDFGLAGESVSQSTGFVIRGTLSYVAPEMVKGGSVDRRVDLYSLGVLLYELVTQHLPFKGDTTIILLKEHIDKIPKLPREINADIPEGLQGVILKLLQKEPSDRFSSSNEVIEAINGFTEGRFALETKETKESYVLSGKFVGRDKELARLKLLFASGGHGVGLVLIGGESGVGKSRLLKEFRYHVQLERGRFFLGRCYATGNAVYGLFIEVLRQLILYVEGFDLDLIKSYGAGLRKIVPELGEREYMRGVKELVELKPEEEKLRLFSIVTDFIKGVKGRVVIGFEDLQWADETSIELLHYLARNLRSSIGNSQAPISDHRSLVTNRRSSIFMCGTYCIEDVSEEHPLFRNIKEMEKDGHCEIQALHRLDLEDISDLVQSILGTEEDTTKLAKRLLAETEGNPLFLEEILKSIVEEVSSIEEGILSIERIEEIGVPSTIKDVLTKRISHLDRESMQLLKKASVIGRNFEFNLLLHLDGCDENQLYELVRKLIKMQVLVEEQINSKLSYNYIHGKLREYLYEELREDEKREFHQLAGRILEGLYRGKEEEIIEELSDHFIWGNEKYKAFHYSVTAGDKARKVYANTKAIKYYDRAITIANMSKGVVDASECIEVYEKRGAVNQLLGRYRETERDYVLMLKMARKANNRGKEISALNSIGLSHNLLGNYKKAIKYSNDSLKLAIQSGDKKAQANCLNNIGNTHFFLCDYPNALDYAKRSLVIRKEIGNKKGQAASLNNIGVIYDCVCEYSRALDYFKRGLEICIEIGDKRVQASGLNNIGLAYHSLGEYSLAMDYFEQSLAIREEIGDKKGQAVSLDNIGNMQSSLGHYADAMEHYKSSLKINEEIGNKNRQALNLGNIGNLHIYWSKYSQALDYFKHSLKIRKEMGNKRGHAYCLGCIGSVHYYLGEYSLALDCYRRSLKVFKETGDKRGEAYYLEHIGRVHLASHEYESAQSYFSKALTIFSETNEEKGQMETLLNLAEVYDATGRSAKAKSIAEKAVEWAETRGAKPLLIDGYLRLSTVVSSKNKMVTGIDWSKSMDYVRKARKIAQIIAMPEFDWQVYFQEGRLYQTQGKLKKALVCYGKCVETFKDVCANIDNDNQKQSYLGVKARKEVFDAIEKIKKGRKAY